MVIPAVDHLLAVDCAGTGIARTGIGSPPFTLRTMRLTMLHHPAAAHTTVLYAPSESSARRDLRWIAVATLLTFLLSSAFEFQERLAGLLAPFETWQADELPLAIAVMWLGLAWYGWRRWADVANLLAHNRRLALELIEVQERERLLLARELHDEMGQHCTAIRIEAAYMQRTADPELLIPAACRAADSSEQLLNGLRSLLRKLRPAELDELGLVAALQALTAAHQRRSGRHCELDAKGRFDELGTDVQMALYRVVQEGLSNVARHARAERVTVRLAHRGDQITLRIEDDGAGFDPSTRTRGLGLLGASERAAALGGTLSATSALGAGTCLLMTLPIPAAAQMKAVA
jgi:signal transduction histidine kinase